MIEQAGSLTCAGRAPVAELRGGDGRNSTLAWWKWTSLRLLVAMGGDKLEIAIAGVKL